MIPHSQKLRLGTEARPAKVSGVWNSRVEDGRGTLGHAATLAKLTTMRRASSLVSRLAERVKRSP
jgi:hypothetical protein